MDRDKNKIHPMAHLFWYHFMSFSYKRKCLSKVNYLQSNAIHMYVRYCLPVYLLKFLPSLLAYLPASFPFPAYLLSCVHISCLILLLLYHQVGLGKLLVEQAKAVSVMIESHRKLQEKLEVHKADLREHLIHAHPIKSKIDSWMKEQLQVHRSYTLSLFSQSTG